MYASKIAHYSIEKLPIGIFSDMHGNVSNVKLAIELNPDVKQWFCLGDVVDMFDRFKNNQHAVNWMQDLKIPTILGNHDREVAHACRIDTQGIQWVRNLPYSFVLLLPTSQHLLCYHSLPDDLLTFVDPGYTEREFVDNYPVNEDTLAVIIGHNHKQFKQVYYGCNSELWSVGDIGVSGNYSIIDSSGIHFRRVPNINANTR